MKAVLILLLVVFITLAIAPGLETARAFPAVGILVYACDNGFQWACDILDWLYDVGPNNWP